jgi:hypothetical protein
MRSNSLGQSEISTLLIGCLCPRGFISPLLLIFFDHVQTGFIIEERKKFKKEEK